ncbi:SpoIIE family protein phosphatase [Streptomyces umbrinus]|uniref:SpoIIE family protein phosphatase n=1 Tax=Streptomyces umbrinus TaxID=67370 RepID=UPI00167BC61A|nr:SpoIIE family protein phosphatase [Streptomyces umbrinus]
MGTDSDQPELPYTSDLDRDGALVRAAGPVLDRLESTLAGTRAALVLTDAQAVIMERRTGEKALLNILDDVRLAPGFCFSERAAGTNGMGTALQEQQSVSILGEDHFCSWLRPFSCMGTPIRHPVSGRIEGVLDLTAPNALVHPLMSSLVEEAARAIEQRLLDQHARREQTLLHSFLHNRDTLRPPTLTPAEESVRGLGALAAQTLPGERSVLAEAAAELIARGLPAEQEVSLADGRAGLLRCHPLTAAADDSGAVVEVCLPSRTPPASPRSSQASAVISSTPLLVGDISVSRLAVAARRRLEFLRDAGLKIGTTFDVVGTARELTEVSVPRFADSVIVDLFDTVRSGGAPDTGTGPLHRVAQSSRCVTAPWPVADNGRPVFYRPGTPQAAALGGASIHEGGLLALPLRAGRSLLGVAAFWREEPYSADDFALAQELVSRAAVCTDNARRYTHERHLALELQHSLLPHHLSAHHAVTTAHRYLPAEGAVGGDWFDVIPLSSARVALVVGGVVGHGVHAAAAMGRLRAAVHTFASLDPPPDELLSHLEDLVARFELTGSTCLYTIYDPVARRCTVASAGHPSPLLIQADGTAALADVPTNPPLGVGGHPFEATEFDVPEASTLVLYTDGLIQQYDLEDLTDLLSTGPAGRTPEQICADIFTAMPTSRDDVALLVAQTHTLGERQTAQWDIPADPAAVSRLRTAIAATLTSWQLEELIFSTELIASELITNAIRHARAPIQARLLRDQALIFEVSDASSTSPRLRRADVSDENGRGIFLVAQLSRRWGTRHTDRGKAIWAEQPLPQPRC